MLGDSYQTREEEKKKPYKRSKLVSASHFISKLFRKRSVFCVRVVWFLMMRKTTYSNDIQRRNSNKLVQCFCCCFFFITIISFSLSLSISFRTSQTIAMECSAMVKEYKQKSHWFVVRVFVFVAFVLLDISFNRLIHSNQSNIPPHILNSRNVECYIQKCFIMLFSTAHPCLVLFYFRHL